MVNQARYALYKKLRYEHSTGELPPPASAAVGWLHEQDQPKLDLDWRGDVADVDGLMSDDGVKLVARFTLESDDAADTSWLGDWASKPSGDCINRRRWAIFGASRWQTGEREYWIAPHSMASTRQFLHERGVAKHAADCAARRDFLVGFREAEREQSAYCLNCYIMLDVEDCDAGYAHKNMAHANVGGVFLADGDRDYLNTLAMDLLHECLSDANVSIGRLRQLLAPAK